MKRKDALKILDEQVQQRKQQEEQKLMEEYNEYLNSNINDFLGNLNQIVNLAALYIKELTKNGYHSENIRSEWQYFNNEIVKLENISKEYIEISLKINVPVDNSYYETRLLAKIKMDEFLEYVNSSDKEKYILEKIKVNKKENLEFQIHELNIHIDYKKYIISEHKKQINKYKTEKEKLEKELQNI